MAGYLMEIASCSDRDSTLAMIQKVRTNLGARLVQNGKFTSMCYLMVTCHVLYGIPVGLLLEDFHFLF